MTEDRTRLAWAWIAAHLTTDQEAIEVLTRTADLEELAGDLARIAAMLVRNLADDPADYLSKTFTAIAVAYREKP